MISRRSFLFGLLASSFLSKRVLASMAAPQIIEPSLDQLDYPPFSDIRGPAVLGIQRPSPSQIEYVRKIIQATPMGPRPIDVAQSFVDRFSKNAPDVISQWPLPHAWNPLVVEFFSATNFPAQSDLVPWCAAFVNWCLRRAGRHGSQSASSQSFLTGGFETTSTPKTGDLAVFSCRDKATGNKIDMGHVAFVKSPPTDKGVLVLGGNQALDGHLSIICEREYPTDDYATTRKVGGARIPCILRLNTYVVVPETT
jgi:uncharacterized protein (TIGR02594 family)